MHRKCKIQCNSTETPKNTEKPMYSLTFQYFRAILCDRRSASDARERDNAYDYFNIKHNEKEST